MVGKSGVGWTEDAVETLAGVTEAWIARWFCCRYSVSSGFGGADWGLVNHAVGGMKRPREGEEVGEMQVARIGRRHAG